MTPVSGKKFLLGSSFWGIITKSRGTCIPTARQSRGLACVHDPCFAAMPLPLSRLQSSPSTFTVDHEVVAELKGTTTGLPG